MRILAVMGSPRKGGNTEILVDEILKMKLFIDRLRPYIASRKLAGKKGMVAAPSEEGPGCCGPLLQMFAMSFQYLGMENAGSLLAQAYEKGEMEKRPKELERDQRFGCMQISNASRALENLSPKLPVVECFFLSKDYNSQEGIVREGCMMPLFRRYIVKQGEEFRLISSREEFLSIFAPVETKEEALGFAVALTSSLPRYDMPLNILSQKMAMLPSYRGRRSTTAITASAWIRSESPLLSINASDNAHSLRPKKIGCDRSTSREGIFIPGIPSISTLSPPDG